MSNTYIEDIKELDFSLKERTIFFEKNLEVNYLPSDESSIYKASKVIYSGVNSNQTAWNDILINNTEIDAEINVLMERLFASIKEAHNKVRHEKYYVFLEKAKNAFKTYEAESNKNINNKFKNPSSNSFLQLVRFLPEYPENNIDIYLDERTGFFGLTIKPTLKGKPVLNLLMKDNKEVIFSFIKRKNGIIKITGRAYFNENLDDSDEIKKILRMFYE